MGLKKLKDNESIELKFIRESNRPGNSLYMTGKLPIAYGLLTLGIGVVGVIATIIN